LEAVKAWKFNDIQNFYKEVREKGMNATTPDGEDLINFTEKILKFSSDGLQKRNKSFNGNNESIFLDPLKKILQSRKSPAEMWKKLFLEEWNNNVDMLYKTNYFKVLEENEKI